MGVRNWLAHAFNVFLNLDKNLGVDYGSSYGYRPDRPRLTISNAKSIVSSVYTRLAIDVSEIPIRHVRLDEERRYIGDVESGLNHCLTVEANIDQSPRAFRQDIVMTLLDQGVSVIVPVDTTIDPTKSGSFDIKTLRVGTVIQWHPKKVTVRLYNEETGRKEDVVLDKRFVAIVDNPLYQMMNEPNSTAQRLIQKLNLLDAVDDQSSSGKLDLIIQLPYVIKSEARRIQAERRRADIELQLKGSKYGIAYTDGTERVTQLNRPAVNNLFEQVKYLTEQLYSQLGITEEVMSGTADEKTMLNYQNRTVKPILKAIVEAMNRSFLTKTARTQRQSIMYFRDPFALVPVQDMAEIADKFTRNEILSSNEIRSFMGIRPSTDPRADELRNSNMPQSELGIEEKPPTIKVPSTRVTAEIE